MSTSCLLFATYGSLASVPIGMACTQPQAKTWTYGPLPQPVINTLYNPSLTVIM